MSVNHEIHVNAINIVKADGDGKCSGIRDIHHNFICLDQMQKVK